MSAQDIWLRKYHELWEKLERIQKVHSALLCGSGWCTATAKQQPQCIINIIQVSEFANVRRLGVTTEPWTLSYIPFPNVSFSWRTC